MDGEVSLDSTDETEYLVGWSYKVILMDLQREIFLKIHALKRERDKESLSLKEGSILRPLRQVRSLTAQLQKSIERKTGLHIHLLKSIKNWSVN